MEQSAFDALARDVSRRRSIGAAFIGALGVVRQGSPAAAISCPGQYLARYWTNNRLSGKPARRRCEGWPINKNWGGNRPLPAIPADNFSARWSGSARIEQGEYTFIARGDDGIRVWIGGQLIIDRWYGALPEIRVGAYVPGGNYSLRIDFREFGGDAIAQFRWQRATTCRPLLSSCSANNQCCGYPNQVCGTDQCNPSPHCCVYPYQACSANCDCCDPAGVVHYCTDGICRPSGRARGDAGPAKDAGARVGENRSAKGAPIVILSNGGRDRARDRGPSPRRSRDR